MTRPSPQPDSEFPYFKVDGFITPDNDRVVHGFFGRQGGVSQGIYASLNCGQGSDDEPHRVLENRAIVANALGCERDQLLSVHQIHSPKCVVVDTPWADTDKPQADAIVTDQPGIAVSVLTADCGPVLFHGQKADGAPVIGAAHAGWGGALGGVLQSTVDAMVGLGAELESIRAAVGPCIGQKSYEVQTDFAEKFMDEDEANEKFFMAGQRDEHLMFDLPGYIALKLAKAGVKNVFIKDLDTYFNEEDFFSYRRTTHREESDYGRQISAILIKES